VFLNKPVCRVPSLAIHLGTAMEKDRKFEWNKQEHLKPILATVTRGVLEGATDHKKAHHAVLLKALAAELKCAIDDICDFELCLCDHQPASIGGLQEEFLFSPRLDNLLSCWTSLQSFLKSLPTLDRETRTRMVCFFDHEEVGSCSQNGADSDMVAITLDRINEALSKDTVSANLSGMSRRNSFLISADMAHGVHPNYSSVHEPNQ
jgi:aspartyl aminopeptidase